MSSLIKFGSATLLALSLALPVYAQSTAPASSTPALENPGGPGPGPGGRMGKKMRDCSQTPNPEQCQTRRDAARQAEEACKDLRGPERRQCIQSKMPAPDCSKAANPERCEAMHKAHAACQDKAQGPERRQCLQAQRPKLNPPAQ